MQQETQERERERVSEFKTGESQEAAEIKDVKNRRGDNERKFIYLIMNLLIYECLFSNLFFYHMKVLALKVFEG